MRSRKPLKMHALYMRSIMRCSRVCLCSSSALTIFTLLMFLEIYHTSALTY
ncbi:hypothetical protein K439DRAFT_1568077 [Ramaria rubella]|nr:hypothetical protein K439DRAFT_1568077 [Ramaria rubella]